MGHYALAQVTPPALEPVTRAEAKAHLRVDFTDDDALIDSLITAARQYVETYTGRALMTQTWRLQLDNFRDNDLQWLRTYQTPYGYPWLVANLLVPNSTVLNNGVVRPPKPPLQSVTSITYVSSTDGSTQTLDPTTYLVDSASEPARIAPSYGNTWPIPRVQIGAVNVTYVCGYGATVDKVPEGLKAALKLMLGSWYENREAVQAGTLAEVPLAVTALLQSYWTGEIV